MKAPIVALLSAAKSVTADVGRSLKALKTARDEEAAQKKVRKAASSATGSCASAVSIFSLSSYMKAVPVLGEGIGVETSCDLHPHRGRQRQGRCLRKRAERQKRDPDRIHAAVSRAGCCAKTGPGAEEVSCRK